jgi:phosphoribosylglycinamide formyltransferase-1
MSYKVAVLISGSGTNLQALIDAQEVGALGAKIVLVVSDRADAYGLQRALQHAIPTVFIPLPRASRAERTAVRTAWEQQLLAVINTFTPDLIVMAGFMRVVSGAFLQQCCAPVINQHPALLPEGGGDTVTTRAGLVIPALRGAHVVADALQQGLPVTGCTIHRVTPLVDDGPILASAEVPILPNDDERTLHERIKQEEQRLIVDVVAQLALQHA